MNPTRRNGGGQRRWPEALVRLRGEIDPWVDRLVSLGEEAFTSARQAPLCVWESEQQVFVEVELPGVARDDLELLLEQGKLTVRAERRVSDPERRYLHCERQFGTIERVIALPESIDADQVEARLEQGVLHLQLNKKPEVLPKKIQVRTD